LEKLESPILRAERYSELPAEAALPKARLQSIG
jgi:hypothetical protein